MLTHCSKHFIPALLCQASDFMFCVSIGKQNSHVFLLDYALSKLSPFWTQTPCLH